MRVFNKMVTTSCNLNRKTAPERRTRDEIKAHRNPDRLSFKNMQEYDLITQQKTNMKEINGCIRQENGNRNVAIITGDMDESPNQTRSKYNRDDKKLTEIQSFYEGKSVMITGATGFLGKILMEKLLRSCPGLENIYLLVRQKRGKDVYTRTEETFDDPMFNRLKQEVPMFRQKVVVMPGDCEAAGLGLSLSDRQILVEKVNIVFHGAATVKFDEQLRAALATNVRAPLHLMRLAKDMKDLSVFMHVSTAYSYSHLRKIKEQFYPCHVNYDQLESDMDKLTDGQIEQMLPTILGPWPNTYTFTKALAEMEIRKNVGNLPLGILRPTIVTSTAKEPLACWLDNLYGPTGITIGVTTGVLRTLQCDGAVTADIVPVDMVVNCLLVAAANVHKSYKTSSPPLEPPIYNCVSSVENRITWGDFLNHLSTAIENSPYSGAMWYISTTLNRSAFVNQLYILFLHLLPAAFLDAIYVCLARKPKMLKLYRKIHKFSSVLSYFITREIQFCNRNVREMWNRTPDDDKQIFPYSMSEVSWDDYFPKYIVGIRRYLLKESDDTIPRATIKWRRLYYLHQLVRLVFFALVIYTLWSVLATLW